VLRDAIRLIHEKPTVLLAYENEQGRLPGQVPEYTVAKGNAAITITAAPLTSIYSQSVISRPRSPGRSSRRARSVSTRTWSSPPTTSAP
jgi:hypothetical protein